MVFYDYIDIGINDNDNDNDKKGIIIDPIKTNLDKIQNKKNCIKLNMSISNYEGKCTIITEKEDIYITTLYQIMINFNIDGLYKLNLNSYKNNFKLLKSFFEENKNNSYLPHIILGKYEDISLFSKTTDYYDLIIENNYYQLKLNLTKLKNKKTFTKPINNYSIDNDNDNDNDNEYDDYKSAKEYCIKNNCSGITFQNNKYHVKNGLYLCENNKNDIYSWIYI